MAASRSSFNHLPPLCLSAMMLLGTERQSEPAAPSAASAGTIQGRRQDDSTTAGGGEKPVLGADGHTRGDGSLRLRGAAPESAAAGDQTPFLHAETRYQSHTMSGV